MANKKKFFFTQISAPIVGYGTCIIAVLLARGKISMLKNSMIAYVLIVPAGTIFLCSMWLRGRLLVLIGIPTKEEAKGYPYSKPWE